MFILGKIDGVIRPTIGSIYPSVEGIKFMLDVGANIEVKPEMLVQFGIMGKVFVKKYARNSEPQARPDEYRGEEEKRAVNLFVRHTPLLKDREDFCR